ncbi:MAG: PEP-CTERM sorting domain-containing protein [Cytophaga sp.]|nr:PEP-CTERM sorting domain-containing protein [Undibacterium sp.]
MNIKLICGSVASALLALAISANATTIGFDPLITSGEGFVSVPSYTESGFTLKSMSNLGFGSARTGDVNFLYNGQIMTWYYGSTSLFNDDLNGITFLSKDDGGTFTLNSIDLAALNNYYSWGSGENISFTGNLHGGGTVTQTFQFTEQFKFLTFSFNGFENLDSVTWAQGFPYHQFDNIVLDQFAPPGGPGNNVPEPASIGLLGLGLTALGVSRRKLKK